MKYDYVYRPRVYMHTSECMHEVADGAARLVIGPGTYIPGAKGKTVADIWEPYRKLFEAVYACECRRILHPDGLFFCVHTNQYQSGVYVDRNALLVRLLSQVFTLVDQKIWMRCRSDLFQPSYSTVTVWRHMGRNNAPTRHKLDRNGKSHNWHHGVWDYPQRDTGDKSHNGWPAGLCNAVLDVCSAPGDLIVDPMAGTGTLLRLAGVAGRRAIGYEIDPGLHACYADQEFKVVL